jgi:hypothetical protein
MQVFHEMYVTSKREYIQKSYRKRVMYAVPKLSFGDWVTGKEYDVVIQQMKNKRICIYKSHKHYSEESGYKVYDTREELEQNFELKIDIEFIEEKIMPKSFKVPEGTKIHQYA